VLVVRQEVRVNTPITPHHVPLQTAAALGAVHMTLDPIHYVAGAERRR
jgi:hypothetical protein